jgi:hypothetical protein
MYTSIYVLRELFSFKHKFLLNTLILGVCILLLVWVQVMGVFIRLRNVTIIGLN